MLHDVKLPIIETPKTARNVETVQEDHAGALPFDKSAILLQHQICQQNPILSSDLPLSTHSPRSCSFATKSG